MTFPHPFRTGLVALTYISASYSASAQERIKLFPLPTQGEGCDPTRGFRVSGPEIEEYNRTNHSLATLTREADGYRGLLQGPGKKDGKLDRKEFAFYDTDVRVLKGKKDNIPLLQVQPLDPTLTVHSTVEEVVREREFIEGEVARKYLLQRASTNFDSLDVNGDGYLTRDDDVNGTGLINCVDREMYKPPKKIRPAKNRLHQPRLRPRRR